MKFYLRQMLRIRGALTIGEVELFEELQNPRGAESDLALLFCLRVKMEKIFASQYSYQNWTSNFGVHWSSGFTQVLQQLAHLIPNVEWQFELGAALLLRTNERRRDHFFSNAI